MAKTINLDFDGYYPKMIGKSAKGSGIYLVYRCIEKEKTVYLKKLIYIGESEKVWERVDKHGKKEEWESKLQDAEVLCFAFASINGTDRKQAEAALIFKHKPECNEEYVDNFPFDQTTVNSKEKCKFISPSFTVSRK